MGKIFIVVLILIGLLAGLYVFCARGAGQMSHRQKVLKAFYPLLSWFSGKKILEGNGQKPAVSFYQLPATANNGSHFDFSTLVGKKVLLVNTASDCGYTAQYQELEQLFQQQNGKLIILAFPANDFNGQEPGQDEAIARFCKLNYQVSFPLMKKSIVVKETGQNPVYRWLTDKDENGWNTQAPEWNFSKYLVNEKGELVNYFSPGVSPLGREIKNALETP